MRQKIFQEIDPYFLAFKKKICLKWNCLFLLIISLYDISYYLDVYLICFSIIILIISFQYRKMKLISSPSLELISIHLPFGIWYSISAVSMIPSKGGLKIFLTEHLNSINDIIILCFILIAAVIPLYTCLIGLTWELILFQRKKFQIRYLCANFDAPSDEHNTLHNLVYTNNIKEISNLLDKKNKSVLKIANFDFSEIDQYGRYPIHFAKTQEMISFLLSKGVEVDKTNHYSGQTLLHLISRRGDLKIAHFLLKQGANINKRDIRKRTPLDYAKHTKMRNLLIENGGQKTTLFDKIKYLFSYK